LSLLLILNSEKKARKNEIGKHITEHMKQPHAIQNDSIVLNGSYVLLYKRLIRNEIANNKIPE
jgi:hypothetical protein